MTLVIEIDEARFKDIQRIAEVQLDMSHFQTAEQVIAKGVPIKQEPKIGHCKDCQYFQHDSVAIVDGIPLIVAHEICSRWGDGCKTKEDGYCFLYEPKIQGVGE